MSETKTKKFNLLKYVYGRLFAEQFLGGDATGCLIEDTSKIYSWKGILYWLKKENYIFDYVISNVDKEKSCLAFKFNRQRTMYDYYLKAIERSFKKYDINITPMGELVDKKEVDDFDAQYKKPVEFVEVADRCLAELNKKISEQIEQTQSESKNTKVA